MIETCFYQSLILKQLVFNNKKTNKSNRQNEI